MVQRIVGGLAWEPQMRIPTKNSAWAGALQDTGHSLGEEAQVALKGRINTNGAI